MAQQQAIHKFVLGNKEVEGKNAEFQYDHGWYSIVLINGEEKEILYKSRNAQEAYMKWNVYIGRKKERPVRDYGQNDAESRENRNYRDRRRGSSQEEGRGRRNAVQEEGRGYRNAVSEEERNRRNGAAEENRSRRSSTKRAEANRSNTEKEENRRPNNSSDAHRNFEKRKAKARKDWSRRRKAEEGEKE